MTGTDQQNIANLPDVTALPSKVILPAAHAINYGQSIQQAIRLAGAEPILAGSSHHCSICELEKHLQEPGTSCLLLVSSRLVAGNEIDFKAAVKAAHDAGLPTIIDGAAQDRRLADLLDTGTDLLLLSAQKYLSAPTAGIILGTQQLVDSVRANERGIGRAMKASKEAIFGVLAAIEERQTENLAIWQAEQAEKLARFIGQANEIPQLEAFSIPDMTGLPFSRACLTVTRSKTNVGAAGLVEALKMGTPGIRVMEHALREERIIFELVPLHETEIAVILERISEILVPK